MIPLYSVSRACRSHGGVRTLFLFERSNLASDLVASPGEVYAGDVTFLDPSKVYKLTFTRATCRLDIRGRRTFAGSYQDINISASFSRPRLELENMVRLLRDARICAIVTDHNGFQRYAWDLLFRSDYTTGRERSDANGYTFYFEGQSDMNLPTISGSVVTDTNGGEVIFTGGGSGACVSINPVPVVYTPSASGNLNNLCEFIRDPLGQLWFIDAAGRAVNLNVSPSDWESTDNARGYVVTDVQGGRWRIRVTPQGIPYTEKL